MVSQTTHVIKKLILNIFFYNSLLSVKKAVNDFLQIFLAPFSTLNDAFQKMGCW